MSNHRDQDGASAVEYTFMVSLVASVIFITVTLLGEALDAAFESLIVLMGWG